MNVMPKIGVEGHLHVDPKINISPTISPNIHTEFNFARSTNRIRTIICCCFYRSRPAKEYYVNKDHKIEEWDEQKSKTSSIEARIKANARLSQILRRKFNHDPLLENEAFDDFVKRINESFDEDHPITPERLAVIVNVMGEMRRKTSITPSQSPSDASSYEPKDDSKEEKKEAKTEKSWFGIF